MYKYCNKCLLVTIIVQIAFVRCVPIPNNLGNSLPEDSRPEIENSFDAITVTDSDLVSLSEDLVSPENSLQTESDTLPPSVHLLQSSINTFFDTLASSVRSILQTSQFGLNRAIGMVDQQVASVQQGVQNASFSVVLEGQKAFAKLYDQAPPEVNQWVQSIGTIRDGRQFQALNDAINQIRENRKKFYDAWEEHEYNFHNTFQNAFSTANQYLGVQELPRMPLGWL